MALTKEEDALRKSLIKKLKPAIARSKKKVFQKRKFCDKKQLAKKEAESILNYITHKGKSDKRRKEVRFYHCPICNHYHLTKKA